MDGVEFLSKHAQNRPEVHHFLNGVASFWNKLCAGERSELQKRLPEIARKIQEAS